MADFDYKKWKAQQDAYKRHSPEEPQNGETFLNDVLKRFGIDFSDPAVQLSVRWNEFIGKENIDHIFFHSLENKVLIVKCDHPSRALLFRMNEKKVLKQIKEEFPTLNIKTIEVRT